jgi:sugar lactone lactonase YvrE
MQLMQPGITFSPSGSIAYVTETGANRAFHGYDYSEPSAM